MIEEVIIKILFKKQEINILILGTTLPVTVFGNSSTYLYIYLSI